MKVEIPVYHYCTDCFAELPYTKDFSAVKAHHAECHPDHPWLGSVSTRFETVDIPDPPVADWVEKVRTHTPINEDGAERLAALGDHWPTAGK